MFLAGVLEHLPALMGLTCPSVNSYTRLQPGFWSSATVSWGFLNREASLRAFHGPAGTEAETTNLELKAIDGTSNPYIALGGLLAASLGEALDNLEKDEVLMGALGEARAEGYLTAKRNEIAFFADHDKDFEFSF